MVDVRIVGQGPSTVEQMTGRVTQGRATLAGAASGAWFELLLGPFVIGDGWLAVLLTGPLVGALCGGLFCFVAHRWTRGGRDLSSVQTLQAQRQQVPVDAGCAEEATRLAARR